MSESNITRRSGLYGFEMRAQDERRREDEEKPQFFEIKQLWQRNHEIINLAARGFKYNVIAKILNVTPKTVTNTLNSELGKRKLSEVRKSRDDEAKQVSEKIRVLTDRALEVYHDIFDDDSGMVSLKEKKSVADTVLLELSGLRKPTQVQSASVHAHLTRDELKDIYSRGMEAIKESAIDVTPTE